MKKVILAVLLSMPFLCFGQENDTFQLYFPLRDAHMTRLAKNYIDSLMYKSVLLHWQKLVLLGYADYSGSNDYNNALSLARAKNVQAYLIESGFSANDVTMCVGKGKIDRKPIKGSVGFAQDRKVQLVIDRSTPTVVPHDDAVMNVATAKVNEVVSLNHIFFKPGIDELLSSSLPELDSLYIILNKNKKISIMIEGHICCFGPPTGVDQPFKESGLSNERARVVYNYLVSKGIAATRIRFKGLGNAGPKAYPEVTQEDMMRNRRVDIRVTSR